MARQQQLPAQLPLQVEAGPLRRLFLGSRATQTDVMPERVRIAIRQSEDESEILVCLVQFAAIATFALLYTLSPKTFPPGTMLEPVPVTLALYALFTSIRFALAIRRQLPGWFLSISVIVDIAVLMVTIWSFHIQYETPPGMYLKAPTLMYAFILIALRALRFDGRYLLLAGAAASLGWLILVAYAVAWSDMGITRDYVRYMTSFDILIGAEIDKLIAFMMVTLILWLVIGRARTLLIDAVSERQAASELSRFFAPEVASRIRGSAATLRPGEADQRMAAVMFIDLRGFTQFAHKLGPREVMKLLGEYQGRMVEVLRSRGGSVDKFMGDGILASFGAVEPSNRFAADAMIATSDLLDAAARWSAEREAAGLEPVRIGIGVAAGEILFGTIGDERRLEYTVIGDPVNLAAKLEKHTKIEARRAAFTQDLVDLARRQTAETLPAVEMVGRREIEGIEAPVAIALLP